MISRILRHLANGNALPANWRKKAAKIPANLKGESCQYKGVFSEIK